MTNYYINHPNPGNTFEEISRLIQNTPAPAKIAAPNPIAGPSGSISPAKIAGSAITLFAAPSSLANPAKTAPAVGTSTAAVNTAEALSPLPIITLPPASPIPPPAKRITAVRSTPPAPAPAPATPKPPTSPAAVAVSPPKPPALLDGKAHVVGEAEPFPKHKRDALKGTIEKHLNGLKAITSTRYKGIQNAVLKLLQQQVKMASQASEPTVHQIINEACQAEPNLAPMLNDDTIAFLFKELWTLQFDSHIADELPRKAAQAIVKEAIDKLNVAANNMAAALSPATPPASSPPPASTPATPTPPAALPTAMTGIPAAAEVLLSSELFQNDETDILLVKMLSLFEQHKAKSDLTAFQQAIDIYNGIRRKDPERAKKALVWLTGNGIKMSIKTVDPAPPSAAAEEKQKGKPTLPMAAVVGATTLAPPKPSGGDTKKDSFNALFDYMLTQFMNGSPVAIGHGKDIYHNELILQDPQRTKNRMVQLISDGDPRLGRIPPTIIDHVLNVLSATFPIPSPSS